MYKHHVKKIILFLIFIAIALFVIDVFIVLLMEHLSFKTVLMRTLASSMALTLITIPLVYLFPLKSIFKLLQILNESEISLKTVFQKFRDGILVINYDGIVRFANAASAELLQQPIEQLIGKSFGDSLASGLDTEINIVDPDDRTHIIEVRASSAIWKDEPVYVLSLHDITEQKKIQHELEDLATHDALTELYNRRAFFSILEVEFQRSQRYGHSLSLLMIDIDRFKQVNDTFGHQAGDTVLHELGNLLKDKCRDIDRVCRYGGEEIAIILPETEIEGSIVLAERLITEIENHSFEINIETNINITISVGASSYPLQANATYELIAFADAALYSSKEHGKNCVSQTTTSQNNNKRMPHN